MPSAVSDQVGFHPTQFCYYASHMFMTLFCEVLVHLISLTVFLVLAIVLSFILLMGSNESCTFISLFSTNVFLHS